MLAINTYQCPRCERTYRMASVIKDDAFLERFQRIQQTCKGCGGTMKPTTNILTPPYYTLGGPGNDPQFVAFSEWEIMQLHKDHIEIFLDNLGLSGFPGGITIHSRGKVISEYYVNGLTGEVSVSKEK
jgi:hypothetical protein